MPFCCGTQKPSAEFSWMWTWEWRTNKLSVGPHESSNCSLTPKTVNQSLLVAEMVLQSHGDTPNSWPIIASGWGFLQSCADTQNSWPITADESPNHMLTPQTVHQSLLVAEVSSNHALTPKTADQSLMMNHPITCWHPKQLTNYC